MNGHKVILNVGGKKFETLTSTLSSQPGTRLCDLNTNDPAYDPCADEYFFDRNPRLFAFVLDFYRSGQVHFPHCYCGPVIRRELEFWGLSEDHIGKCCWTTYKEFEEEQSCLKQLQETFTLYRPCSVRGNTGADQHRNHCYDIWKRKVWLFLEDQSSSFGAMVWSYVYMSLLLVSIGVTCMETHPMFRVPALRMPNMSKYNITDITNITNAKLLLHLTTESHPVLVCLEYICCTYFFLELLLRMSVWPGLKNFFKSFFNIIDIFAVLPSFVLQVIYTCSPWFWMERNMVVGYLMVSISSVFRSIRILKLMKHSPGLQIIYLSIKASIKEILLLIMLMLIGTLIFATIIYFVEFSQEDCFNNIPIGFWWSIITMTTVGYGDTAPKSGYGYIVGALCALTGMLITGLPIPVIANSFHHYYNYARVINNGRPADATGEHQCEHILSKESKTECLEILPSADTERVSSTKMHVLRVQAA